MVPGLAVDFGLCSAAERRKAQTFVRGIVVQAIDGPILPWTAWVKRDGVDVRPMWPLDGCTRDELRTVARADSSRRTVDAGHLRQEVDDVRQADTDRYLER